MNAQDLAERLRAQVPATLPLDVAAVLDGGLCVEVKMRHRDMTFVRRLSIHKTLSEDGLAAACAAMIDRFAMIREGLDLGAPSRDAYWVGREARRDRRMAALRASVP